ncbi:MAG: site-2 protease family protein [Acidobacteria bacterium]|nr:site-2 protease family protein [Acidobacteriota bacterium]MBS1867807.1 site-2 protease family protein [Acidobacteriota bacterium]
MPDITPEIIVRAFIWYVVFLFSTTCHEAAHALAAKLQGDDTAAKGGQVTLNPIPHIRREPYGMVLIPVISCLISGGNSLFGWASAPFDPDWERRHPRRSAIMAMAGPAANFTLMFLAAAGLHVGVHFQIFRTESWGPFVGQILFVFFALNLLLGVFNLVPAPPLDGSSAIMFFMNDTQARRYLDWLRGGNMGLIGLLIAILIFRYIYPPIESVVATLLLPGY